MKKNNRINPWLLFFAGIIVGVFAFAVYNYIQENNINNIEPSQGDYQEPANFNIGAHDHIWGNKEANIELVVFNDLSCSYSRQYIDILNQFMRDYSDKIKIVWRHFPLDQRNEQSLDAALAAECSADQDKFWEFINQIYSRQPELSPELYFEIAENLSLDKKQFETCYSSQKYNGKVKAHYYEGISKQVIGTPTSFLNGRILPGVIPYYDLAQLVNPLIGGDE